MQPPNPTLEIQKFADLISSFYNRLVENNVPDYTAMMLTASYMTEVYKLIIQQQQTALKAAPTVDYNAIREFVITAIRENQ